MAEQQAKVTQVDAEQAELRQQADLVQSTLQPLVAEREKLRLLAQADSWFVRTMVKAPSKLRRRTTPVRLCAQTSTAQSKAPWGRRRSRSPRCSTA